MPTREAVTNTIVQQKEVAPIPERIVQTRAVPKPQIGNQQTTTVSTAAADTATPEESVKLSPQLSALARKEQAFRQREQAQKQKEKDFADKLAKADQFDQLTAKMKANDYSEAEKLGLKYDEYSKYKVTELEGSNPQDQALQELRTEIANLKKTQEESIDEQFTENVAAYRKELTLAIETKPEFQKVKRFEEEDANGKKFTGIDIALQVILDAWNEDGEEMTVAQALEDTELLIRTRAQKMAALIEEPKPAVEERRLPPPKPSVRTLTNQMQPQGNEAKPAISLQSLSESERYAEARRRALARRNQGA